MVKRIAFAYDARGALKEITDSKTGISIKRGGDSSLWTVQSNAIARATLQFRASIDVDDVTGTVVTILEDGTVITVDLNGK
jgi:hypothetical protein